VVRREPHAVTLRLTLFCLASVCAPACSFVLDPDELRAERAEDGVEEGDVEPSEVEVSDATEASDEGDGPRVIVDHSGMVSCTFAYRLDLTQCPQSCGQWRYVVDASRSVGVGSFSWTFEATGGFSLSPAAVSRPRVELTLGVPECLVGGTDMRPFSIVARLSVDGAPAELVPLPQIGVAQVTSCSGEDACLAP